MTRMMTARTTCMERARGPRRVQGERQRGPAGPRREWRPQAAARQTAQRALSLRQRSSSSVELLRAATPAPPPPPPPAASQTPLPLPLAGSRLPCALSRPPPLWPPRPPLLLPALSPPTGAGSQRVAQAAPPLAALASNISAPSETAAAAAAPLPLRCKAESGLPPLPPLLPCRPGSPPISLLPLTVLLQG
jgi:hypothetical protein